MWFFVFVFELLVLVLIAGVVRAALQRVDEFFDALIERLRNSTNPAGAGDDTAAEESIEEARQTQ
ncbi:hypothetical protein REH65_32410 [Saccharopolyspora sp. ID03-671]|uniref:hypothetical protein n=1 Tax=Saccharopolyspora sp. ID03-671 TaxID=3073066 RepID=UPI003246EA78